jgi:hypothetical protein
MGCITSNNNIINASTYDEFKEKILNNKYTYLKNCLNEYIDNSVNNQRFINQFCNNYENSSLKRLSEDDGIKSVYDIIELLCYVPLKEHYSGSHLEMEIIFKSFVIKFKKNMIKVSSAENELRTMFYRTSHMIKWNAFKSDSEPGKHHHQDHYIKLEFKTICAIIDIVNIECNLFTNKEWISRYFVNMINEFKIVKPHTKLLQKMNELISEKNKIYTNHVNETIYTITALNHGIQYVINRNKCRVNELNSCDNSDYNSVGNLLARGKDTADNEINQLKCSLHKHNKMLKVYTKKLECTTNLLNIICINSDEPNKSVIKEDEPIAYHVSPSENTNTYIPIAEAVLIN